MDKVWWYIKCLFGFGTVNDGSICWFSSKFHDVHDYHIHKGGDGDPSHFFTYHCWRCGKEFWI